MDSTIVFPIMFVMFWYQDYLGIGNYLFVISNWKIPWMEEPGGL